MASEIINIIPGAELTNPATTISSIHNAQISTQTSKNNEPTGGAMNSKIIVIIVAIIGIIGEIILYETSSC